MAKSARKRWRESSRGWFACLAIIPTLTFASLDAAEFPLPAAPLPPSESVGPQLAWRDSGIPGEAVVVSPEPERATYPSQTTPAPYMPMPGEVPIMAPPAGAPGLPSPALGLGPCASDGGGVCCPPCWSVETGTRIFTRNRPDGVPLSTELTTQDVVLSSKSESFDVAPGAYFTLGRYLGTDASNRDRFLEFGFWTSGEWDVTAVQPAAGRQNFGTLTNPLVGGTLTGAVHPFYSGFAFADEHRYDYDSTLWDFELNYWFRPRGRSDQLVLYPNGQWRRERHGGPVLSYMVGLRGMVLNEDFELLGRNRILTNAGEFNGEGRYGIETENTMFGFQVGTDLLFFGRNWEWGFRAKAAPMLNQASQDSRFTAGGDPFFAADWSTSDDASEVAFLGEFGVLGRYWVTERVHLVAAYDLEWLFGVALAPEQVETASTAGGLVPPTSFAGEIRNEGMIFMHGLSLGVEWEY